MKITNRHNLPETFVKAVEFQDSTRKGIDLKLDHISVTRLIESPRIRMLTLLNWKDIKEDVTDRLWALLGQSVHALLSWGADPETIIIEQRLYAKVQNWTVSGQLDALDVNEKRIYDYKVTSVYGVANGVKPEWERQLNLLRLLAIHNGYEVESLEICVILRDWQSSQALRDQNYPPIPVLRLPVPVWPIEDTRRYLEERVRLHQEAAYSDTLPECSAEERWEKPTAYAVMKPTRKTAVRVFYNQREADELAAKTDGAYVQVRPGEAIRCARYCAVAQFCES
jgi:hypothetical protein